MTLKMTTAQVVETSVTVTNSSFQNYIHPDDHTTRTNLDTNECYIKSCLVYKYLFEYYFRKNVSLNYVMTIMDITDFLFITNSPVLKNHVIFHHAFKTFWKRHKKGRPVVYIFDTTIRSSILGFVTGVVYWFFHKGVV